MVCEPQLKCLKILWVALIDRDRDTDLAVVTKSIHLGILLKTLKPVI